MATVHDARKSNFAFAAVETVIRLDILASGGCQSPDCVSRAMFAF